MNRRNFVLAALGSVAMFGLTGIAKALEPKDDFWIPLRPDNLPKKLQSLPFTKDSDRRIWYVDVPKGKAEEFIAKIKAEFRKRKTVV